jgi:hypothetical protein
MCNQAESVTDAERTTLLVEYQAAQASAEHHDGLVWVTTSIIWAASLVLLGVVAERTTAHPMSMAALAVLAILLHCFLWGVQASLRALKLHKYERCRNIERRLGFMTLHRNSIHVPDAQTSWYVVIQVIFILGWATLAIAAIYRGASACS